MPWYAVQVKDFYNRPSQYMELMALLRSSRYRKKDGEFFIPGGGVDENPLGVYVFIREQGDFYETWDMLCREKYINAQEGFIRIPDRDMESVTQYSPRHDEHVYSYGDIVHVEETEYSGLYGIVLGVLDGGDLEVGFNLFIGPRIVVIRQKHLKFVRSLFEIWKFKI